MELVYRPPGTCPEECVYLEKNLLNCLKEKSVKDNLPSRVCKPEELLWFFLECPKVVEKYEDKSQLRQVYIDEKLKELNPPAAPKKK